MFCKKVVTIVSVERRRVGLGGDKVVPPKTDCPVQCISGTRPPESLAMSYEGRRCFSAAKAPPEVTCEDIATGSQAVVVVGRNCRTEFVGS